LESWWEILSVFLLSTVKFVFGAVPLALVYGFSFFETVTVTSLGGFVGVTFFVFMSDKLIADFKKRKALKDKTQSVAIPKKIFTHKNKIIVVVKHRFGLLGIALLTPLLLSIPIGCFLAVRYFKDKHRILIYMFCAILFWSVSISSFKLFFH
jgi:uncharacterized membrane protein